MRYVRYTLAVGLNDRETLKPIADYETASKEIAGRVAQLDLGATITRGTGVYKHERGDVVIEETVVISVIDFEGGAGAKLDALIASIKRDYNQESIAVMVDKIESKLA